MELTRAQRLQKINYSIPQEQIVSKPQEANIFEQFGQSALDLVGNLGGSVIGLGESVVDATVGLAGGVGGLFGADTKWAEDFVKNDFTGDVIYKPLDSMTENSWLKGMPRQVIRGVGQMLPTVAVIAAAPFTGGASLAALPYTIGASIVGAGGSGMQEALNDGANFNQALGYGATQSILEGGLELATGGFGRLASLAGKTAIKGIGKTLAKEALSEAFEEGTTELLNPLTKSITYKGKDALQDYSNPDFYKGVGESALVGGLTSLVTGGAMTGIRVKSAGGLNQFTINDLDGEKQTLSRAVDKLQSSGKLSDTAIDNYIKQSNEIQNKQAEKISKLNLAKQNAYVEKFGEPNGFTMTEKGLTTTNSQTDETSLQSYKSAVKNGSMSASLLSDTRKIHYAPTTKPLTFQQQEAVKLNNILSEKGKGNKLIISDRFPETGMSIDGVSYINANITKPDLLKQTVIHEFTHTLEGTKEYSNFAKYILNNFKNNEKLSNQFGKLSFHIRESLTKKAYYDSEFTPEVNEYVIATELVAQYTEKMFTDEAQIKRLANTDKGLASRILNWIKNKIALLKSKKGGHEKYDALRFLQHAENLYSKAIKESFGGISITDMDDDARESKEIDNKGRKYIKADRKVLFGESPYLWGNQLEAYINYNIRNGKDLNLKTEEGDILTLTEQTAGKGKFWNAHLTKEQYKTKLYAEAHIDEIAEISVPQKNADGTIKRTEDKGDKHLDKNFAKDGWEYRTAFFEDFDGNKYRIRFSVAVDGDRKGVYNIGEMKKEAFTDDENRLTPLRTVNTSNTSILPQGEKNVNSLDKNNSVDKRFSRNIEQSTSQANVDEDSETSAEALTEIKQRKVSLKEKVADSILTGKIHYTNAQAGIEDAAEKMGIEDMESLTNSARAASNAAVEMMSDYQYNRELKKVGKGLKAIFQPVYNRSRKDMTYRTNFFEYLLHHHNVDRMGQDKKVFGEEVTAEKSLAIISELDNKYPEFKAIAVQVWKYNDNLLALRVDYGLVTLEQAKVMREMYPHYVPTFREGEGSLGTGALMGKYNFAVSQTVKSAKGSNLDILPLDVIMARQTMSVLKTARVNEVAKALYEAKDNKNSLNFIQTIVKEKLLDIDIDYDALKPKDNEISFYQDGHKVTMKVTKEIFVGFNAFAPNDVDVNNILINGAKKFNSFFKKLVTEYNPFFLGKNAVRDLQEALFYTKHNPITFIKNMVKAAKIIRGDGLLWQQYKAIGGLSSSVFDFNKGVDTDRTSINKILHKPLDALAKANLIVEQLPRFTEFTLSVESGKSFEQALLDSADVTTNFSRSGTLVKKLNSTIFPFLNPSIQGFSKLWRTVTGKKTAKEWIGLIIRALVLGIGASALNDLLNGDDEDYANLNQRDKDNNYLFKIGDSFLKIPKGRVTGVLGSLYLHGKRVVKGEQNVWEAVGEWGQSALSNLTPVNNFSRTIFSPFSDINTNTTWYGGTIEGRAFDNIAPKDRYDASTSEIAKFLGQTFNYSPKKIHYLLDQYSGIIGDIILPLTTPKAEKDILESNFFIDPKVQNKISQTFYDELEASNFDKSAGEKIAYAKVRYFNKIGSEVSDLYKQKRDIENSKLSYADKQAQSKTLQVLINQIQKTALTDIIGFTKVLEKFELNYKDEKAFDEDYRAAMREYFGAERTLKNYNKNTYEKAQVYNAAGIDYEKFYDIYFKLKEFAGEERKAKVEKYISSLKLTAAQKYLVLALAGYKAKNGETTVKKFVSGLEIGKEQKESLLKWCGYMK